MKESTMSSSSKTDWERLDALTDEDIDTSDSPPLTDKFFANAKWLMPGESSPQTTVKVELDLDPKILAWFQSQGQDYERRMRAALRLYAEAHQAVV
jgi:uncharacterized protein (DUF4415 family)